MSDPNENARLLQENRLYTRQLTGQAMKSPDSLEPHQIVFLAECYERAMVVVESAEKDAEIERLRKENERLNQSANAIMDALQWTGDGYEWNPKHGHYVERPRDAVARGAAEHRKEVERFRAEVAALRAENEELRDAAQKSLWDFDEIINPMMRGLGSHEFTLTPADLRAALSRPPSE